MIILPIMPFELTAVRVAAGFVALAKPLAAGAFLLSDLAPWAAVIIVSLFLLKQLGTRAAKVALLAAFGSGIVARFVLTVLIRVFVDRPRPFEVFGVIPPPHEPGHAFPSGHAAFFFGFAFALWPYHRPASLAMLGVGTVMGMARVAIAVHWPSDIIVGAAVGYFGAWLAGWGIARYRKHKTAP